MFKRLHLNNYSFLGNWGLDPLDDRRTLDRPVSGPASRLLLVFNYQGRVLAGADLHVDVLLLGRDKTYGGHFSSLLHPDKHELRPLDGYVGDRTI